MSRATASSVRYGRGRAGGVDLRGVAARLLGDGSPSLPRVAFLERVSATLAGALRARSVELRLTAEGSAVFEADTRRFNFTRVVREQAFPDPAAIGTSEVLDLSTAGESLGTLRLSWKRRRPDAGHPFGALAQVVADALFLQRSQAAVQERVKELTCLYGITQLAQQPDLRISDVLGGVVRLLPAAWQYPEVAAARVRADGTECASECFDTARPTQRAEISVGGQVRGFVEVAYLEDRPTLDEGPFLHEERALIDAVARHLALLIERREAAEERARLQEQLRHADRLATIGQLAAGVAHELNEPLGNVLGFAQLAARIEPLPAQAAADLEKIIVATLHAREVAKRLVLFARQAPASRRLVNLNEVIAQGLYFLESRCARQAITVVRRLDPTLPATTADPSQLQQVLVNLVVNAIQAMPEGGTLTIETRAERQAIALVVGDSGVGMSDEVLKSLFTPFFTTRDVDQGTGLGLAVVHGIVSGHGGTIAVDSEVGRGSRFEIRLPVRGVSHGEAHGI